MVHSVIYSIHIQTSNLVSYCIQTFVSLSSTTHDFSFLSLIIQGELLYQPCRQLPCLLGVFYFTLGYPMHLTSSFNQVFSSTLNHSPGSIGNFESLLDHLVSPGSSRSSALHGACWILYYTLQVCLRATKLKDQDYVVLSATNTTLQQQKVEAKVCTRKAEPCCVQLAIPPVIVVALSWPVNSIQQSDQAPHRSLPILNGNLLLWPRQVLNL